jgi:hypothetical protein
VGNEAWHRVADQISPGLKARGFSDEQIRTISESTLGLEAANVQRGPVERYLLSKDGQTIALKHDGAISELKVSDALSRTTAPPQEAAERSMEVPAMTR